MKMIKLSDFLTQVQIKRAIELKTAKEICREIVLPNIKTINKLLEQENDPMYLAYAIEYAIGEYSKKM